MYVVWLLLVVYAAKAACTDITRTKEDLAPIDNENAAMWKKLFAQLNTMSSELEKLSQGQAHLNQRFDELSKRLDDCENRSLRPAENYHDVRADAGQRRKELIETVQEFRGDFNKRQDIQDNLLRQSFSYTQQWMTILSNEYDRYESANFNKTWSEYQKGISINNGQFMGLDILHVLTTYESPMELMIILKDWSGETRYARYDLFQIGNEAEKYSLKKLGSYRGDAGDSLMPHLGQKFSTWDQDNDDNDDVNCASVYGGGWWFFGDCQTSLLTGSSRYWSSWHGWNYSLKSVEMKIRPTLQIYSDTNV